MNETVTKMQTKTVEYPVSPLPVSDTTGMADAILTEALVFCADKMGLDGREAAVASLRQGDRRAYGYFQYGMAKQAAECLGTWDEAIKAIYLYEEDATPEDVSLSEGTPLAPAHLLALAQRKTSALNSLATALDRALSQSYARLGGVRELEHLLDVQTADDSDVVSRIGFGALLASLHHRPIKIWER